MGTLTGGGSHVLVSVSVSGRHAVLAIGRRAVVGAATAQLRDGAHDVQQGRRPVEQRRGEAYPWSGRVGTSCTVSRQAHLPGRLEDAALSDLIR